VCVCVCVCSSSGFCSSITLYVRVYGSHILHLFLKHDFAFDEYCHRNEHMRTETHI